jgi:PAS domain S-box-containing protein
MGFQQSPPRQFVDSQGRPYGSVIDLLREAARRAGVRLDWIQVPAGPDRALSDGIVDLWPIVNQLPERKRFHFSEPYAQATYWLVTERQNDVRDTNAVAGRVVGITEGLARTMAQKHLPQPRLQAFESVPALIASVCDGTVFAAVIPESPTHASVFRKPEDCELRMSPIPGARLWAGIASSPKHPDAARVADLLRHEIGLMVQDGTFSTISVKWFGYPTNEAAMVEAITSAHREADRRTAWLAVASCAAILLLGMAARLWRDKQLLAHQDLLEQKVAERTTELALAKDKAETACVLLEQSRARFTLALDGASEALWDCDIAKRQTYYSERWSEMLGFSPEEIGDSPEIWDRLVHPDDYSMVCQALQNHLAGLTESYQAEYRMRTKDGGWRWIQARGKVVERAGDGSPIRVAGTHLDVTERKQAEQALARQHYILDNLIESVPDHIYFKDRASQFIQVNRAMVKLFGANDPAELIGKSDFDFFTAEHAKQAYDDEQGLLEGRQLIVSKEEKETWPDGHQSWVQTTKLPLHDDSGAAIGTFGISRDITERKRMEQALRTAKEAAEAASRAKSEFLANMSHEIRTPLNGVIGMTGLLLDTELSTDQRDYAETVRRSGEALLVVLNDVLDFSKIEAGELALEPFPFDLRLVLEEVNEMLACAAEEKKLELILRYPPNVPRWFIGDAGRLRQVVTNLVGNAVKFTATGHVLIGVEREEPDGQKAGVRVSVSDTGPGILSDKLNLLFKKFSQVDGSITRKHGGAGLGLAISKQLVELMGGTISVQSRPGEGTTFWFSLPLPLSAEPPAAPAPVADLRGLRVLIVDDNEVNRRVLHEQISSWEMRNGSYAGAVQALQALREARAAGDPYQVALLDYQMPEMDGATLAAVIKADPLLSDTVVIMLASVGAKCGTCKEASMDACLVKPVRQSQLLNTLGTVWSKRLQSGFATRTEAPREIAAVKSKLADRFAGTPARVLVAEDNVVNQKVAVRMLERLGLRPDVAADGREAVELCTMLPYDLIFMDCQMPEMDGYTATAEIRKRQGSNGRVAIIAMTAEAMEGSREQCIAAGMDDYIAKPVRLDDMIEALEKWVPQAIPAAQGL